MAKSLSSKAPSDSKLDVTVVTAVVVCALLAGVFAYWRMGPGKPVTEQDFRFSKLDVDQEALDAQRQQKYSKANLQSVQTEWQELVAAAREANRLQFGGATKEEQLTLSAKVRVWANEVLVGSGLNSFAVTGEPIFRECNTGLEELLGAVQRGEVSIEEARTNPSKERFETYRANCGALLPTLLERGLVTDEGQWSSESAPIIVDVLSRYRWAHIIHDQKNPWAQLTREGARIFSRWRVEQAHGYSLEQRRKFLETLVAQFPDYDARFAAGVLAYRAGEFDRALEQFEALAQIKPQAGYEKYADFLRKKTGSAKNGAPNGASKAEPAAAKKTN